jgi:hypothetical protein
VKNLADDFKETDDILKGYAPGVQNIGKAEIMRRKITGLIGLTVTIILYILFALISVNLLIGLILIFPSTMAALGFIQAKKKFCAYFGVKSVYNFDKLGQEKKISDLQSKIKDRREAFKIFVYSVIIGILVSLLGYVVPFYIIYSII